MNPNSPILPVAALLVGARSSVAGFPSVLARWPGAGVYPKAAWTGTRLISRRIGGHGSLPSRLAGKCDGTNGPGTEPLILPPVIPRGNSGSLGARGGFHETRGE